ncbi:MAG: transcription elongation factor GreA [Lachnospiraceae bacterium]|nr:transcription elongation factor GreA [Lachnospiraceae bacterium]
MAREQLTKNDVAKIEAEIEDRKVNVRKKLIKEVQEARAQGDLSENFEYYAAKKAKNENESRISYLERLLRTAEIISDSSKKDEVGLNNTVTVYFEEDDEEQTFKIVTSIRGNSIKGMISNESPMGKALMGKKVGSRVKIAVNDKYSYYVVIKNIDKSTDDSNDTISKF